MARIRLDLTPAANSPVFRFIRPGGALDAIPALYLTTQVNLTAYVRTRGQPAVSAGLPRCVIDTGSHLSVLPEYIWSQFYPSVVTPLPFDPAMPHRHRSVSIGGGNYPYELGELTIPLRDVRQRTMDLRVVAQLTRDGGALNTPLILGLRGGALDGRVLRAEPDAAAPFGQAWSLADP